MASTRSARSGRSAAIRRRNAFDALGPDPRIRALGREVAHLEIVVAEQGQQGLTPPEGRHDARHRAVLGGVARQPEPPGVEGHGIFLRHQPGLAAQGGMAAVGGNHQIRLQLAVGAVSCPVADAGDAAAVAEQRGGLMAHPQAEGRLLGGGLGEEVQEVPLRHHGDVVVRRPAANRSCPSSRAGRRAPGRRRCSVGSAAAGGTPRPGPVRRSAGWWRRGRCHRGSPGRNPRAFPAPSPAPRPAPAAGPASSRPARRRPPRIRSSPWPHGYAGAASSGRSFRGASGLARRKKPGATGIRVAPGRKRRARRRATRAAAPAVPHGATVERG